ncbi:receptor-like protein kinase FERONIA [Quercus lobata]|uniref:Protein kinase domain-containing protein n=1 Tax=Quercus lobata TaxID=97700 RepID=A0A7N2KYJ2_QUELO|nr:receptor-like protein kinase FERONIA [Quercus lobata]
MANRSNTNLWTTLRPCFTSLYLAFLLHHFTSTVSGVSSAPYVPVDNILLNCGSSSNSTAIDGRTWIGDDNSKFFPQSLSQNHASLDTKPVQKSPSPLASQIPYTTARLSVSAFTYIFPVTTGQKFIRLYFYPASYSNFDRSRALFSVKAGPFTLLNNFNASLTADADADPRDTIFREFCVNVKEDERLNLTFTPSDSNSFAFINGIEILSMPSNLYYTPSDSQGFSYISQQNLYVIGNGTALEALYRINVGGKSIVPNEDTGVFRTWETDQEYMIPRDSVLPLNMSIELIFTKISPYTAPENVYRTARTMGNNKAFNKNHNLTWEFSVDSQFDYLVRLHFCEFQSDLEDWHDRVFLIFIANQVAEKEADVMVWSGRRKAVPVYRDYAVSMFGKENQKKMNLSITLQANPDDWRTTFNDAILNGIEIFKISDPSGNLAGPNPDPLPLTPQTTVPQRQSTKSNNNTATIIAVVGGGVAGFIVLSILGFLILQRAKRVKDSSSSDGTTRWGPFSFATTTKSTNTRGSSLPSDMCRYFTLAEIKAATKDFDNAYIIGVGGFGDVYKGYIDNGTTSVAIKRLKPGSQQGAHEFETEIRMLSQLRHLHLVSLIGFCNDGKEMILVYDYMAHGTLRDHLYNTNNPPLSWKQRLQICIGAARGLNYLHTGAKQTIIHRDVKTTNILLDEKWMASVSDFGLSKFGPTGISKAHVSTVVKGSFGYLDPEYYRRQQLTEKSDVYSFGVVLFEVLCARPPIVRTVDKKQVSLAEWARQCCRNGKLDHIVDQFLKGKIAPECLKKFGEIAVSCLLDNGTERPSMNDVVWGLEFALQLQECAEKDSRLDLVDIEMEDDQKAFMPKSTMIDSDEMFSSSIGQVSSTTSDSSVNVISREFGGFAFKESDRLMSSGAVFSEIVNPRGR